MPRHPDAKSYELADALVAADAGTRLRRAAGPRDRRRPDRRRSSCRCSSPTTSAAWRLAQAIGPRSLTRRGHRGDRREGLPGAQARRAGAGAPRRGRRSARSPAWPRSSSTCASAPGEPRPLAGTTGSGWCWRRRPATCWAWCAAGGRRQRTAKPRRWPRTFWDDPRDPALLAGRVVAVNHALGGGAVDEVLQLAGACPDLVPVSALGRVVEAAEQRLDGRSVSQVAVALLQRAAVALLLLLDVRHAGGPPSVGRRRMVAVAPGRGQR